MKHDPLTMGLLAALDIVSVVAAIIYASVFHLGVFTMAILGYSMMILVLMTHLYVFKPEIFGLEGKWA